MTHSSHPFHLETSWTPASKGEPLAYALRLTNNSGAPVENFRLAVSGPARLDPAATLENGTLTKRLSNHTELAPPDGFVLKPDATWVVTARGLSYPLRHWSDGANTAYLVLSDQSVASVSVSGTVAKGDNRPLKRGAARFPVPVDAPVSISVVPWPNTVAVSGRRPTPAGLAPAPLSEAQRTATAAFADLAQRLFPAEGLVRDAAEGGMVVRFAEGAHGEEGYRLAFAEAEVTVEAASRSGYLYGLITLGQILRGARRHQGVFLFPGKGEIVDEPAHGLARQPSRRRPPILFDRRDQAVPRHPGLEQAQPLSLASVRRRSLARRDRSLSAADGNRRLARPWPEAAAAAWLRSGKDRRLLLQGGDPRRLSPWPPATAST